MESRKCRGDVFFARDGKGFHLDHAGIGSRDNFACALEAWSALRVSSLDQVSVSLCALHFAMAPHLTSAELDFVFWVAIPGQVAGRSACSFVSQAQSPRVAGTNIEAPPWCAPWDHLPALAHGDTWGRGSRARGACVGCFSRSRGDLSCSPYSAQ